MATESGDAKQMVVMLCVDASQQAKDAVDYYLSIMHKPTNSLVLVHAVELPDIAHARQAHVTPDQLAKMYEEEKKKSEELEATFKDMFSKYNVDHVKSRTEGGGKPGVIICRVADEEKAGMIVIGTRGLGTIRRTLLGSVSDYVVHHSHCPVVVCRHPFEHGQPHA